MALPELLANSPTPGVSGAETALAAAVTDPAAVSITTAAPARPVLQALGQFRLEVDSEVMLVTGGSSTTTWTVVRGVEGTTAATHASGASVYHVWTAGALDARYAQVGTDGTVGGPSGSPVAAKSPRGPVSTPERHGALADAIFFTDGAMAAGTSTITSSMFNAGSLPLGTGSKRFYLATAGAGTAGGSTSAAVTTSGNITSLPRTSGALIPPGPVLIQSGSNGALFWTTGAAANAAIPVQSQTPNFAYPAGSTISFNNTGINGTVSSVSAGSATVSATATHSVSNMVGWYGTDDSAAVNAAIAEVMALDGGTVLLDAKNYLCDGALGTGSTHSVIRLAGGGFGSPLSILGVRGNTAPTTGYSATGNTKFLSTRLGDTITADGIPSLIGGTTMAQQTANFGATVTLKDFDVYLPENGGLCGIDLSRCLGCDLDQLIVQGAGQMSGSPYGFAGIKPTNAWAGGIIFPQASNDGLVRGRSRIDVGGMYFGVIGSEHMAVSHIAVFECVLGLGFPTGTGTVNPGGHTNSIDYLDIEGCIYGIAGWNPSTGVASIATGSYPYSLLAHLDIEDHAAQWAYVAHILDANNMLAGQIRFFRWAAGPNNGLTITGGANLKFSSDVGPVLPFIQTFTANGTATKPPTAVYCDVYIIGGGCGGQSGPTVASGTAAPGGNGAGSGAFTQVRLLASDLPSTVAVSVAGVSSGGAAISANSTGGTSPACQGNGSGFGTYAAAAGGALPTAFVTYGTTLVGVGTTGGTTAGTPPVAGISGATGPSGVSATAGGGGAGGGITTGAAAGNGGAGAAGSGTSAYSGGGNAPGGNGGNGQSNPAINSVQGGGGGGGGAAGTSTVNGGTGGTGAYAGGGGGGGGAALNGRTSGAGGTGGPGGVMVVWT
jgi:hypothetical protein